MTKPPKDKPLIPNAATLEALEELRQGRGETFNSVDKLMSALNDDEPKTIYLRCRKCEWVHTAAREGEIGLEHCSRFSCKADNFEVVPLATVAHIFPCAVAPVRWPRT